MIYSKNQIGGCMIMIKNRGSLFITTFLIICFFFVALTENVKAGTPMPPMQTDCTVLVDKVEIPDNGVDFDFDLTGDVSDNFGLFNGESTVLGFDVDDVAELRENIPEGYTLSIECTEGVTNCGVGGFEPCLSITLLEDGTGVSIECLDNDTGSCTFTNTLVGKQVPTLSEWGLIAMAGILGIVGFMVIRRRKATA